MDIAAPGWIFALSVLEPFLFEPVAVFCLRTFLPDTSNPPAFTCKLGSYSDADYSPMVCVAQEQSRLGNLGTHHAESLSVFRC